VLRKADRGLSKASGVGLAGRATLAGEKALEPGRESSVRSVILLRRIRSDGWVGFWGGANVGIETYDVEPVYTPDPDPVEVCGPEDDEGDQ